MHSDLKMSFEQRATLSSVHLRSHQILHAQQTFECVCWCFVQNSNLSQLLSADFATHPKHLEHFLLSIPCVVVVNQLKNIFSIFSIQRKNYEQKITIFWIFLLGKFSLCMSFFADNEMQSAITKRQKIKCNSNKIPYINIKKMLSNRIIFSENDIQPSIKKDKKWKCSSCNTNYRT